MTANPRRLGQSNVRINTRASPLIDQLRRLLSDMVRQEAAKYPVGKVAKAESPERLRARLRQLLRTFGLRMAADAANDAAGEVIIPPQVVEDAIRGRRVRLGAITEWVATLEVRSQAIEQELRRQIADAVQGTLLELRQREAAPTQRETALAIRGSIEHIADLSFNRSFRIARTELAMAQNTGAVTGYQTMGVERLRWLAYKSPIWPRRHDKMDGEEVPIGGLFTLPSGARMRWPHDPLGPVGEIVNCRCSVAPVRTRGR